MKPIGQTPEGNYIQPAVIVDFHLGYDGDFPNNPALPLLIYQRAIKLPTGSPAEFIEHLLASNQWGESWRDGIYSYAHYHSTAHEVLAVFSGSAKVHFGGKNGVAQTLRAGDVVIIPAGVAHKRHGASQDFAVIGAYPVGQHWDMCYGRPEERADAERNILRVPLPKSDPVYGPQGPLLERWGVTISGH
jgi:uncharacterized protein YjlB